MKTIVLNVPEDLAEDAEEFGLLENAEIVTLLRSELDRRIMDFVNREIRTYRAEKARGHNGSTNGSKNEE